MKTTAPDVNEATPPRQPNDVPLHGPSSSPRRRWWAALRQRRLKVVAPGDDEVPVPAPMDDEPPHDRFCDLVMTGGVASGVVYPWAIVEIARAYRFRNIGGTSVGAMAAALAAAAEYGRRVGFAQSFEILRRTPAALGEDMGDGRTRMLSLFQANPNGRRLVKLWGQIMRGRRKSRSQADSKGARPGPSRTSRLTRFVEWTSKVSWAYRWPIVFGAVLCGLPARYLIGHVPVTALTMVLGGAVGFVWAFWRDIRLGVIDNNLGLCKGGTLESTGPTGRHPGLCEWLHEGIQLSAGLKLDDRPLTFRDLWSAPATPGALPLRCDENDPVRLRSINLELITSNVTHGRPYRLPLNDTTSRLFFKPEELVDYFPPDVLHALIGFSKRYERRSKSDPETITDHEKFYELPGADLPLVVAARLSLSFPLLFSAVPLWAIDYEAELPDRRCLRRCLFTDGGASSNFPVHLFDAAMPTRPTFGMWLDRKHPHRPPRRPKEGEDPETFEDVWLPEHVGQGRADSWDRFDALAKVPSSTQGPEHLHNTRARGRFLFGFLRGLITSAVDWRDRTTMRLPHVRTRVARLRLEDGEGGLNIGMSRKQILNMAHRYGTQAGRMFVSRFQGEFGEASVAWREQRWVRLVLLIEGLRARLDGLKASAEWSAYTEPMTEAIARAQREPPIGQKGEERRLQPKDAQSLQDALSELEAFEASLKQFDIQDRGLRPRPELGLRAQL